jgi:hypothetical protein
LPALPLFAPVPRIVMGLPVMVMLLARTIAVPVPRADDVDGWAVVFAEGGTVVGDDER